MNDRGIKTLYGRWLIDGAPRVLLFDTSTAYGYLDEWKGDLWSVSGIPSPPGDTETNEAIVFGYLIAWFLGEVRFYTELEDCKLTCAVRLSREAKGRGGAIPRMVGRCGASFMQEAPH